MKAPKRFIKFIEQETNINEIFDWIMEISDEEMEVKKIYIVDEPMGEWEDDYEYCYQVEHASESGVYAYGGTYYHKIEDSDLWLAYEYYTCA